MVEDCHIIKPHLVHMIKGGLQTTIQIHRVPMVSITYRDTMETMKLSPPIYLQMSYANEGLETSLIGKLIKYTTI